MSTSCWQSCSTRRPRKHLEFAYVTVCAMQSVADFCRRRDSAARVRGLLEVEHAELPTTGRVACCTRVGGASGLDPGFFDVGQARRRCGANRYSR
jgi:hypothetical protein